MKLLLQRTLSPQLEGPFWVENSHLDGTHLHAFLIVARDHQHSYFEPRYSPAGEPYWISDRDGGSKVYRNGAPLTRRPTFKFDFAPQELISLQSQDDDSPYALARGDQLTLLDSSLTHLAPVPGSDQWVVSSLENLYLGPLDKLISQGPTPARRFSPGPEHLYYTRRHQLLRQPLAGGPAERLFACQEGDLVYPCWTPQGILVTQEDSAINHLWLVDPQKKEAVSLWSGPDERVYACDFIERT
ncbi:hypothetical protein IV102_22775 [bacterium]|nr:hypothetical protein [bacterium]